MAPKFHALVTGVNGVLGWRLSQDFLRLGWRVEGTYCSRVPRSSVIRATWLDLLDLSAVKRCASQSQHDLVIHCAAVTKPDLCQKDPETARRVNLEATEALADHLPAATKLIFISTDLVFDGLGRHYQEEDTPSPVNYYAETKLSAERRLIERPNTVILRMAKIYAAGSPSYPCFMTWMRDRFESGQTLPLFWDQYRSPLYVGDMSRVS